MNSWNDWDPLEEVLIGRVDGAMAPPQEPSYEACLAHDHEVRITLITLPDKCNRPNGFNVIPVDIHVSWLSGASGL